VKEEDAVAYSSADHRFHLLIYDASGNDLLKDILTGLRYKALPLAFKLSPHFSEFIGYHRQILDAFKAQDGQAAENAIRQHNRRMIDLIKTTPWGVEE
jgi:DNA-binding GntR family transcriptional regulator